MAAALQAAGAKHGAVAGPDGVTVFGAMPPGAVVEAGSVTKGVVGLLLAAAVRRSEVSADDRLGVHLAVSGPAAGVTLGQLATHTSGLPRLPAGSRTRLLMHPSDPYRGLDLRRLLASTDRVRLGEPGYSNLGVSLLGHALATAAGTTFWELADARVLQPLGMTSSGNVAITFSNGRPWRADATAPAGGLRSTADDLLRLAAALNGPSPLVDEVAAALVPRAPAGSGRVGWCWMLADRPAGTVAWHNGGTGSAWAFVGARTTSARDRTALAAVVGGGPQQAYDLVMLEALGGALGAG